MRVEVSAESQARTHRSVMDLKYILPVMRMANEEQIARARAGEPLFDEEMREYIVSGEGLDPHRYEKEVRELLVFPPLTETP
ncbi:hypothetical protein ACFL0Y_00070 [Patescibacteria group bacterium]